MGVGFAPDEKAGDGDGFPRAGYRGWRYKTKGLAADREVRDSPITCAEIFQPVALLSPLLPL
jgi:hypothetical protein